jgi:glycerophosphoryl diester phosphodiesterase
LEYLKTLDVGFGYSPDKGLTFPTRGLGEGLMPTFEEIVATFPDRQFAINDKDADTKMVQIFLLSLSGLPLRVRQNIIYLGEAAEEIKSRFPEIQTVGTRKQHTTCIEWWLALGWTGYIHPSCKNTIIALPIKYAHKLSWVLRSFIDDLHSENSKFWIWDVNSPEDAKFAKSINPDAIGTYRIDKTIDVLK